MTMIIMKERGGGGKGVGVVCLDLSFFLSFCPFSFSPSC